MSDTSWQILFVIIGIFVLDFVLVFPIYLYAETDWGLRRRELAYLRGQRKRANRAYLLAQLDIEEARYPGQREWAKRAYLVAQLDFQDARYRVYDRLWQLRDWLQRDPYEDEH